MTAVEVADELLTVHVQGIDRFWALRRRIIVPLSHVRSIERTAHRTWRTAGFRLLGAEVPGLLRIGRFSRHGERVFWDVHHPERTIEIELANEPFDRLIVEVKNPEETTREVQRAIAHRSAARSDRSPRCRPNSNVNNPPQPRERLDHVAQQGPGTSTKARRRSWIAS